jgi:hypothetical protein
MLLLCFLTSKIILSYFYRLKYCACVRSLFASYIHFFAELKKTINNDKQMKAHCKRLCKEIKDID